MGECQGWLFEPTFNRSVKLRQADPRITSDAGALLLREVDHRLGLTADLAAGLYDPRRPDRIRYTHTELLRQHLYTLALGYAHQDDQDSVAHDPALKLAVWDRPGKQVLKERLASQPSDWRLVDRLSTSSQRRAIREALPTWIGRHQRVGPAARAADGAQGRCAGGRARAAIDRGRGPRRRRAVGATAGTHSRLVASGRASPRPAASRVGPAAGPRPSAIGPAGMTARNPTLSPLPMPAVGMGVRGWFGPKPDLGPI